ncbi:MAG TPA: GFA family protein [Allosphingosinicella sp.]|nr:GFA family protein [Allosphingosinicella sp.]
MPRGACLCGAVSFEVKGDLPPPDACHCSQCRKSSGHYFASTDIPTERLTLRGAEHVTWYRSSEKVRRGFCSVCGSPLFWDPLHRDWTAIAMGAFEAPTGTRLDKHIFVHEAGDYYEIADGLKRYGPSPDSEWLPGTES